MRIDRFTEIFIVEGRTFLVNFRTGAIDEVEDSIIKEINKLKKKGSFTPLECGLKEPLIEEMIERGYITYYSDKEEADEIKWSVERYKEKAKKGEKTASILLDSSVGRKWCYSAKYSEDISMNRVETENILRAISKGNLADEIDLWLNIKDRELEWTWIKGEAGKNGLKIKNLYTFAKNETELEEIKNWLKNSILFPITINVKYKPEDFVYISLFKQEMENIYEKKRVTFIAKHPLFCPFIYRTFFIDKKGNISYCVKKFVDGDKTGRIDIVTGELNLENGWSKGIFSAFCDKYNDCIYSIYCRKICAFLNCSYEDQKSGDECNIISTIKRVMEEKIRSMM